MSLAIPRQMPRLALFLVFNLAIVLSAVVFLLTPVLGHFAERSDQISESAAQLAHFRKIARSAGVPTLREGGDPFLPANEERVASADLQASLKTLSANAGVNLLGIRGMPASRFRQIRMVVVSVELEGSLAAMRDMIVAIEGQTPFLFVTVASFRSVGDIDNGPIRVELKIQGALRDSLPPAIEAETNE